MKITCMYCLMVSQHYTDTTASSPSRHLIVNHFRLITPTDALQIYLILVRSVETLHTDRATVRHSQWLERSGWSLLTRRPILMMRPMCTCLSQSGRLDYLSWWPLSITKRDNVHLTMKTMFHFKRITTIHLTGNMNLPRMEVRSASLGRRPAF